MLVPVEDGGKVILKRSMGGLEDPFGINVKPVESLLGGRMSVSLLCHSLLLWHGIKIFGEADIEEADIMKL
ncbi:hypothetical protein Nepgr_014666 [Nepenthes gracilis]|uniref:Uncharacterized protein n=1 Tax=Nepenthes gracilis TaxID=150966 RepID=A0AAD3XQP7_NEPGR|nr:hypothetical protein Nepgr_014666 [Nepenthes gracilis]